jgi:flagellar biosynthesis protein FlhF
VPSRFAAHEDSLGDSDGESPTSGFEYEEFSGGQQGWPAVDGFDYRERFRQAVYSQFLSGEEDTASEAYSLEELAEYRVHGTSSDRVTDGSDLVAELAAAGVSEDLARALVERARQGLDDDGKWDRRTIKSRIAEIVAAQIEVCGPISVRPSAGRIVAFVGPTGVGKTTTIAKLAAHYRLRERLRVGLITVDTYRIAAVDQLRTYAEIMDLPMEVVSTPREMRQALHRLEGLDLILMDTAGRSPGDAVRIRELKSMLAEAQADEVQLVLSGVAAGTCLQTTAERFMETGVSAIVLTKLDEVMGLGNLLPLIQNCRLPFSYLSLGQGVPDDIETAEAGKLTRFILGMERA